jgi:ssDNA-specific exonuclease RecJ
MFLFWNKEKIKKMTRVFFGLKFIEMKKNPISRQTNKSKV